jgi:hypothetical protein
LIGGSRLSISMAGSSPKEASMAEDPRKAEYDQRVKAQHDATAASAKLQQMPPTPTQEENDLMALGLMHIDDKDSSQVKDPAPPPRSAPEPQTTRRT